MALKVSYELECLVLVAPVVVPVCNIMVLTSFALSLICLTCSGHDLPLVVRCWGWQGVILLLRLGSLPLSG